MHAEQNEVNLCPLCRSRSYKNVFSINEYTGRKCIDCGLVFISPVNNDSVTLYTDDLGSSPSKYYEQSCETDMKTFSQRLDLIDRFTDKGAILDIGCSTGTFMKCALEKNWKVVRGIEPNPVSAAMCRKNNLYVLEGFFNSETAEEIDGTFDTIHLGDILEHIADPAAMVNTVISKLNDNGIIVIATPNYGSYIARKFQIKPEEHLLYFDENSIKQLMHKCGLKVLYLKKLTRKRDFRALKFSTTFRDRPFYRFLLMLFHIPGIASFANLLLKLFVKDELLLIAQKNKKLE